MKQNNTLELQNLSIYVLSEDFNNKFIRMNPQSLDQDLLHIFEIFQMIYYFQQNHQI